MRLQRLFTDYADAINQGRTVNPEDYLHQCDGAERKELEQLIGMLQRFQTSTVRIKNDPEFISGLFSKVEQRRKQRLMEQQNEKRVANFRLTEGVDEHEIKKSDELIDKYWKREFNDE